jgi:hypothetical protein
MREEPISMSLRRKLHDTIEAYHIGNPDVSSWVDHDADLSEVFRMVECDQEGELTIEGGIDALFEGELRDRLMRVL